MQNLMPVFTLSCVFIFWALIYLFLLRILVLGMKSKGWPSVQGKIVTSEVIKIKRSDTGLLFNPYVANIRYEYIVTESHSADLISFGDIVLRTFNRGMRDKRGAEKIVSTYPLGKSVAVYYDPNKLGRSVLKPGIWNVNFILALIVFTFLGVFFLSILLLSFGG